MVQVGSNYIENGKLYDNQKSQISHKNPLIFKIVQSLCIISGHIYAPEKSKVNDLNQVDHLCKNSKIFKTLKRSNFA